MDFEARTVVVKDFIRMEPGFREIATLISIKTPLHRARRARKVFNSNFN